MDEVERKRRENEPLDKPAPRPIGTRHIQILLDRSGSMGSIKASMEEGFGSFLAEQRAIPGAQDIQYVLSQFDSQGIDDTDVGTLLSAQPLVLTPRGGTPLYRSIVRTIEKAEKRMKADDVMLFVVITDGQNNEGAETLEIARAAIAKKMDEGWAFIYLGANQDAWDVGRQMGYDAGTTMDYAANPIGVRRMSATMSATASLYRGTDDRDALRSLKIVNDTFDDKVKVEAKQKADKAKAESKK